MNIQVNSRDKKPKLRHLLGLSAAAILVVSVLNLIDPDRYAFVCCVTVAVYCLFAALLLLYSFREQIRYNPYSYNTIFYFGFALFSFFVMIIYILLTVQLSQIPEGQAVSNILHYLTNSPKNFILFTSPFILAFSGALCVSNLSLIRHEGLRPVNLLGILLSFLLVAGAVFLYAFDYAVSGSVTEVMIHDLVTNVLAVVYLYFECMLIGVIVADAFAARYEPEKNIDFLIILGCALRSDGTPKPLLRGRIERAISFYEKQKEQTGRELTFIASGGQGADEVVAESTAIRSYLIERGIPEDRILEENRSTSTFENMKYSKEIIQGIEPNANVAFSTTNYHVFRSGLFARRVKMRAVGMGAKTKWYFWPNAAVREFAGLLVNHRLKQALILGTMTVSYLVLTFLSYRYY